jgi:predicted metal-dependent phosphoesterase TrpH
MHELVVNLHMHTTYSDGSGTHAEIAEAAMKAGIDAVIVTDHNVLVNGLTGYYQNGRQRVLVIVGEEVHDQTLRPPKNHLLVFGALREVATQAFDSQRLIDTVLGAGGLAFLAHPVDPAAPAFGETDISWENWEVHGFNGIELWNAMSEFKSRLKSKIHGLYYAFNPRQIASGPFSEVLRRWDDLLKSGRKVVAIGGSDAHAFPASLGPIRRKLFPYEFHFRTVNTHLFVPKPLVGEVASDVRSILEALRQGHAFVGYDLPESTRGFRFTVQSAAGTAWMGDTIPVESGATLQIHLPRRTECRLLKDGAVIKTWSKREVCTHIASEPGVYRVEVFTDFLGRKRGWIFSNPIYLT